MYAIRKNDSISNSYDWLRLDAYSRKVDFQMHLNLACIRTTEKAIQKWLNGFNTGVERNMQESGEHAYYNDNKYEKDHDLKLYFALKECSIVPIQNYDRFFNYDFKPVERNPLVQKSNDYQPHCSCCGSTIFDGHHFIHQPTTAKAKSTGKYLICAFCILECVPILEVDIAKIPPNILEQYNEARQSHRFLEKL